METSSGPSAAALKHHVTALAGEIGERNAWHRDKLLAAADYIRRVLSDSGYRVKDHTYVIDGEEYANIEASLAGGARADEVVVIGAHYDSVIGSPGANDNGTGVAAVLELARLFAGRRAARTLRFVAFVNEEPPFFRGGDMGSQVYARAARARNEDIRAMLSLETMGYYRDEPKSQRYPPPLSFFYPDTGNFIGFVANFGSRALLKESVAAFRAASKFPIEHIATFEWLPGVDWSDHGSFWQQGYPALMITDTAPYRYPYYHTAQDTPDKVNYDALAEVTRGLAAVVSTLANPK